MIHDIIAPICRCFNFIEMEKGRNGFRTRTTTANFQIIRNSLKLWNSEILWFFESKSEIQIRKLKIKRLKIARNGFSSADHLEKSLGNIWNHVQFDK